MVGAGNSGAPGGCGNCGELEDAFDFGSAGNAGCGVRSRRMGGGAALREARSAAGGGAVPRAARNESGDAEIAEAGAVEALRNTFRARRRVDRAYRADVCGTRFESPQAD